MDLPQGPRYGRLEKSQRRTSNRLDRRSGQCNNSEIGLCGVVAVSLYKCVSHPADKTGSVSEKEIHL